MSLLVNAPATVLVFDLTPIWLPLNTELDALDGQMNYKRDDLIDMFLTKSIHDFQVVAVAGYYSGLYPAQLENQFSHLQNSISLVWEHLWFPPEQTGRTVLLKRIHRTLWMVFMDPHHFPKMTDLLLE